MKKFGLATAMLVFFFNGLASFAFAAGPDPFEGLTITPPDDSVSADVRGLYGKSGKWGGKSGWDGIWLGGVGTGGKSAMDREPGYLAVVSLSEKEAVLIFGYGRYRFRCEAKITTNDQGIPCLEVRDNITTPFSNKSSHPPVFCLLNEGKIRGGWWGYTIEQTITLVPLD
jgi:hypothetical protein